LPERKDRAGLEELPRAFPQRKNHRSLAHPHVRRRLHRKAHCILQLTTPTSVVPWYWETAVAP